MSKKNGRREYKMLACKINVNKSIETKKGKKPIKWKREHRRRGEQIQGDSRKGG